MNDAEKDVRDAAFKMAAIGTEIVINQLGWNDIADHSLKASICETLMLEILDLPDGGTKEQATKILDDYIAKMRKEDA